MTAMTGNREGPLLKSQSSDPPMVAAEGITHSYGKAAAPVLQDVSMEVQHGEVLGLIGPNGSGKTTLLRTLYGAVSPSRGSVYLEGEKIRRIPPKKLARRIAVVVQEPPSELMFCVADIVLLGRTPHLGTFERASQRDDDLAGDALEKVGLIHMAHREFAELSGGEKQRVLIARALAQQAQCLLLDEPTNHLDISYQHQVLNLVRTLGITAVVVLHDLNLAARYCDRIVMLSQGRIAVEGTPEQVFTPHNVEPVYAVASEQVTADDGTTQLLFRPKLHRLRSTRTSLYPEELS